MSLSYGLHCLGIEWKPQPKWQRDNLIRSARREDTVVYVSDQVPIQEDGGVLTGKVGGATGVEEGAAAAANCAVQCLYAAGAVADVDEIVGVRRMWVTVNCTPTFTDMDKVADGASDLLVKLFGNKGRCVRITDAAVTLPDDAMVKIAMEVLVKRRRWWRIFLAFRVA